MFEQLKEMNVELEKLKKTHLEKSKAMFTEVSKQVFDKHPALESFSWRQYTPYFNDGDECIFSVHSDYPKINDLDDEPSFDKELITDYSKAKDATGNYPKVKNKYYNPALAAAEADVKEFLSNIDDAVLRDMFGDHVEIKVTRAGTEVEDYEHD